MQVGIVTRVPFLTVTVTVTDYLFALMLVTCVFLRYTLLNNQRSLSNDCVSGNT